MALRLDLRTRILCAMGIVVAIVVAAFAFTVHAFIERLELELLHRVLVEELQEFAHEYAEDPDLVPPTGRGIRGYIARDGARAELPAELSALDPGLHEDVIIEGHDYNVGRTDVADAQLFLLLDAGSVERLEARLLGLVLAVTVVAFAVAALFAVLLSRALSRPLTRLVGRVAGLDADQRGVRIATEFGDPELGALALAIDRYLERMDAFVQRERSFTECASHELRTPLSVISNAAELIVAEDDLTSAAHERMGRIARASAQMQAVLEALLFLGREESNEAFNRIELDKILTDCLSAVRETASAGEVEWDIDIHPAALQAHAGMAACVINNLLLNAATHAPQGRIGVRLDAGRLVIQDSGPGIPELDRSRIFDYRYRSGSSPGMGLGLHLVGRICERLRWQVSVASTPANGSSFEVRFEPPLRYSNADSTRS